MSRPVEIECEVRAVTRDAMPADFARCRGRAWPEDTFLAPECQTCKRWVAHYCDDADAITAHVLPPTERECPLRVPVEDCR